jgi:hypothetical protein
MKREININSIRRRAKKGKMKQNDRSEERKKNGKETNLLKIN